MKELIFTLLSMPVLYLARLLGHKADMNLRIKGDSLDNWLTVYNYDAFKGCEILCHVWKSSYLLGLTISSRRGV